MTYVRKFVRVCAVSLITVHGALALPVSAADAPFTPHSGQPGKDVVWVPTPQETVDAMLDMAGLTKDDYLVDLGAGDGRTVITAAKRGARAHGIEYNPDMVALAKFNAEKEDVAGRATFVQGDIFQSDFSSADIVTLFLLPSLNVKLRPILLDMKPGTRVVSNSFDMAEWQPDDTVSVPVCVTWCTAYKWIIPAKVEGTWQFGEGRLTLKQTFQMLDGTLALSGAVLPISDAKLNGTEISFLAGGKRYTGQVTGNDMKGSIDGGGAWSATRT